ncbi:MAG: SDR family oxidoreductase [Deltaproteobacteria bacterium]|nr:SDR family oxidoreductase [Deltaproteobacteria bacterium]MBI3391223.1 SDR family oxidoreductase [Deltaproteobacteria bacterium]
MRICTNHFASAILSCRNFAAQCEFRHAPAMARLGTPEDIACAVPYLASPVASWVTGKIFEVDGGPIASNWPFEMPTGL